MDATIRDVVDRLDGHDARFDAVDARFDAVDARFDAVDARFDRIEDQLGRAVVLIHGLAEGQAALFVRQDRMEARLDGVVAGLSVLGDKVDRLAERVDGYAALVVRGFSDCAARDLVLEKRLDGLEQRVVRLETKAT